LPGTRDIESLADFELRRVLDTIDARQITLVDIIGLGNAVQSLAWLHCVVDARGGTSSYQKQTTGQKNQAIYQSRSRHQ
jgi:hypothetical protein